MENLLIGLLALVTLGYLAAAVLFLSSELSAFTTGSVLAVDGGFLAQ